MSKTDYDTDRSKHSERYTLTSAGVLHKIDLEDKPDLKGNEYRVIEELEDGYTVYVHAEDPSQPTPTFFIHKRYIKP